MHFALSRCYESRLDMHSNKQGRPLDGQQRASPEADVTEALSSDGSLVQPRPVCWAEVISAAIIAAAAVILPLVFGELYPFSIAPMFRDRPQLYCAYVVLGPDGKLLPLERFQLQRNYDGNPVGFGAGRRPFPTLDQFGTEPSEEELRMHVFRRLTKEYPELPFVDVLQVVVGATDSQTVGIIRQSRMRVEQHVR